MKTTPFICAIPQDNINDLKARLHRTRWPDEIEGAGWKSGTSKSYLQELCEYWADTYLWQDTEEEINEHPNFLAEIDGYTIHYIHVKGSGRKSVPLLITHGWPGSFLEMLKLVPLLTIDPEFSFDLVIPSVIGFGFSDKPLDSGCNAGLVAELWHKLMIGLGYNRYGLQGGDIGAGVSSWLALKHPESIIGLHLNYVPGSFKPFLKPGETLAPEVIEFQKKLADWVDKEGSYSHQHATKPQTLAYGLNDSPVGLCAWILEKFYGWSDNNGDLESVFTKDELLGNITLYWLTQTISSSIRMYQENKKAPLTFAENDFIKVPVAFTQFPKELPTPPRSYIEKGYNIQQWTVMPKGGHFAAMEQPELLSEDIKKFFKKL